MVHYHFWISFVNDIVKRYCTMIAIDIRATCILTMDTISDIQSS